MIRLSATHDETAALDAKFDACRRKHWKLLKLPEHGPFPASYADIKRTIRALPAISLSLAHYNNQLAVDGQ